MGDSGGLQYIETERKRLRQLQKLDYLDLTFIFSLTTEMKFALGHLLGRQWETKVDRNRGRG